MNPPSALYGAMNRERKPFTYTPGGLDLSEIKSERMAKRLMRNAMNQGVPEVPVQQIQSPPANPIAIPNFNCLPVQVFPTINLPANPKTLLRTRSTPENPRDPIQRAPVQSHMSKLNKVENNTRPYSQTNNNHPPFQRPNSMHDPSTPAGSSNTLPRNYGSNDLVASVLPEISYDAEYFQTAPKNNYVHDRCISVSQLQKNSLIDQNINEVSLENDDVRTEHSISATENGNEIKSNINECLQVANLESNRSSIKDIEIKTDDVKLSIENRKKDDFIESSNKLQKSVVIDPELRDNTENDLLANGSNLNNLHFSIEPVSIGPIIPTLSTNTRSTDEQSRTDDEQKSVKVVKKQVKKETKSEVQNGTQNGDSNEAELTVKLPTKKSAAKTETNVEIVKKHLPDGSIEEVKTTTTKTTIDGKTTIAVKTETTVIPKPEEEEVEEEVEEEEEEEEVEENEPVVVEEVKEKGVKKSEEKVVVEETIQDKPNEEDKDKLITNEVRSETTTTTTKKVTVVQKDQSDEEEEEEVVEEEEEEEVQETGPQKDTQPSKQTNEEQKEEDEQEEEEEEEEVEEEVVEKKQEQKTESVEEVEKEEEEVKEVEENEEQAAEEKAKESDTEQNEENSDEVADKSEKLIEKESTNATKEDDETEYTEEEYESEKEEVTKPETTVYEPQSSQLEEAEKEVKPLVESKVSDEVKEEIKPVESAPEPATPVTEPARQTVPQSEPKVPREPSIPLEKVEDVEIKPIGPVTESIIKSHSENTEIITSERPSGPLKTQTEYNRIENIVTVNRTTKTLDQTYENTVQHGVPTVKTYFAPSRERTSISPSKPYQPVYSPVVNPPTERRHSLLLERLSMERQLPTADIYQNNYQGYDQHQQPQWNQEPQAEVLTVSNVKPSTITNQQWYQQTKKENVTYSSTAPTTPANQTWKQPPLQQQQSAPAPLPQTHIPPQPQPQIQPTYQPSYTESTKNTYQQNNYQTYAPKPTTWNNSSLSTTETSNTYNTPSNQYSFLSNNSTESYQKSTQQYSSSYVPPPWEQDSNYVADSSNRNQYQPPPPINQYQPPPPASPYTPSASQGWTPAPPKSKFSKPPPTAYIPPAPNQSFVKTASNVELPRIPGKKTYYSEYERRYITVPESTYVPNETKPSFQPQPDPSPQYYYDNNEPAETVEPQWRKELREFTEKTSQTTEQVSVKPPWEEDPKYVKAPSSTYTSTPTWSQTLRPRSWRERSFESEYVGCQETAKNNTLGRGRPVSSYGKSNVEPIPERPRGVSVDRYNPNIYQSPIPAEHPPVQTHVLNVVPPAKSYHNPNVPAYHTQSRASVEPREPPTVYQQPRQHWGESRASPIQSRSFKYLQWITGTDN